MPSDKQKALQRSLRLVMPIFVFLAIAYGSWVYAYYVCWGEVRKHHSVITGNGLIAGEVLLVALIYIIWLQLLLYGPGQQPNLPLYRLIEDPHEKSEGHRAIDPPIVFACDPQGFPIWCSNCHSIKAERSHHSSRHGYCVPRFDHYCTWIGSLVGKRNFRLFVQFCVWFLLFFIYVGVSSAVYAKDMVKHTGRLNPNVIVLFVLCAFWMAMLVAMSGQYLYYVAVNQAAIEDLELRRNKRSGPLVDKFYNVRHQNTGYVLRVNPFKENVFDKGLSANWLEIMGHNPLGWFLPLGSGVKQPPIHTDGDTYEKILGDYTETPSQKWILNALERIQAGDYITKMSFPTSSDDPSF